MPAAAQQRLFFFPGVEALFDVWVEQVKALAGSGKGDSGKGAEKGTNLFFHFSFEGVEKINLSHFFLYTRLKGSGDHYEDWPWLERIILGPTTEREG